MQIFIEVWLSMARKSSENWSMKIQGNRLTDRQTNASKLSPLESHKRTNLSIKQPWNKLYVKRHMYNARAIARYPNENLL